MFAWPKSCGWLVQRSSEDALQALRRDLAGHGFGSSPPQPHSKAWHMWGLAYALHCHGPWTRGMPAAARQASHHYLV